MLYVVAVHDNPTGGPETLHQFAREVRKQGIETAMVYCDVDTTDVPEKFKIYGVPVVRKRDIADTEENMIIAPETKTAFLYQYKRIQKCIWWLSKNFYYGFNSIEGLVRCAERIKIKKVFYPVCIPLMYIRHRLTPGYFKFGKDKNKIFHLYNCEDVRAYLEEKGVKAENTMYMCGPIRNEYFECEWKERKPIVAYNPKKNYEFTEKILKVLHKRYPELQTVAIEGMKPEEIVELLSTASVYMDFGHFPGPERIPREAVTCGCNIVTSRYGSAANKIDVLVPEGFKIEAKKANIGQIADTVEELVKNYPKYVREYDAYRKKVVDQKELFVINSRKFVEEIYLKRMKKIK